MSSIKKFSKFSIALAILLPLTACKTLNNIVKQDSSVLPTTDSVTSAKLSEWQKAYGVPQQSTENKLALVADAVATSKQITTLPPIDIWQRIRNGYAIKVSSNMHPTTEKHLARFIRHPDYINRVIDRARPYLHYIVTQLELRNMPLELALLPVVESAYKPYAFSSGSAAGIWQFIPSTGKVYGLEQNWWYDGRRDIIESTRAALDYLDKLHTDFGTWPLALAAYNSGEGTVGRAIKRNIKAGKASDFWSLKLPKETLAYVPKLLAISALIKQPEKYNLTLNLVDNSPYLTVVQTGSQFDLALAAKLAGISTDQIYLLNPGYNRWATSPSGPHRLVLPINKAASFQQALTSMPVKDRVQWTRHKIQSGESLARIATRYKTTIAVMKKANGLTSSFIRAGKYLLIPVAHGNVIDNPVKMTQSSTASVKSTGTKKIHTVIAGDTWWDLAKLNNVDIKQLTQWNNMQSNDMLQLGQKLVIWRQTQSSLTNTINYTTKTGDSLWKISRKFNVQIVELREWNGLSDRTILKPGLNLTVHIDANNPHGKSI